MLKCKSIFSLIYIITVRNLVLGLTKGSSTVIFMGRNNFKNLSSGPHIFVTSGYYSSYKAPYLG